MTNNGTVSDKSYVREKLRGFCGFSMKLESFPYECFEQWQHFQYRQSITMKVYLHLDEIQ